MRWQPCLSDPLASRSKRKGTRGGNYCPFSNERVLLGGEGWPKDELLEARSGAFHFGDSNGVGKGSLFLLT